MMKRYTRLSAAALLAASLMSGAGYFLRAATHAPQTSQTPAAPLPPPKSRLEYASMQSPSLGKELKYAIQFPPSYQRDAARRYPVLYFLHGMFGSEQEFQRRGVAAAVSKLRDDGKVGDFIIVSPAGENSFYLNAKNGVRYEDAIVKDLIPHVEKTCRAIGTPAGRAIQGISMGGFGALMIAFKYPEMFSSVSTHCAALFEAIPKPSGDDRRSEFMLRLIGNIFGNPPDDQFFQTNNPMHLGEANAAAIKKSAIKIYFDCGEQDRYGFQESNKVMDARLTKAGVTHEFHLFPGNHGWEYMVSVADHSYIFLWQNFKPADKAAPASRTGAGR